MKEHEIVAAVRRTAGLEDPEQAKLAVRTVLQTLGERLAGGEPGDLAAQLPPGIAEVLPPQGQGERFGLDEFFRRVAEREECDIETARQHARVVIGVLKAAVTPGEFEDVVAQLPKDYADLLDAEPVAH